MSKISKLIFLIRKTKWKLRFGDRLLMKGNEFFHKNTNIIITDNATISMGERISTSNNVHLTSCSTGKMVLGDNVFFNRNDIVICRESIMIGNNVDFGPNIMIYDHDHIFDAEGHKKNSYKTGSIVIEDNCWIGAGAIILRNSHIGEGCVIGACAVIKGEIPPHSLVKTNREINIKKII